MKQVDFIDPHSRTFEPWDNLDKSSITEQNLRLSQAERAMDMANGRIPAIPPAQILSGAQPDPLPEHIQSMMGLYHNPFIDPATKARVRNSLKSAYADYISERESLKAEQDKAALAQKEAEYADYLLRIKDDLALMK